MSEKYDLEPRFRKLEVGEVLDRPHVVVKGEENHQEVKTDKPQPFEHESNEQCTGTVTVKGSVKGIENLAYVETGCDACGYTAMEESIVLNQDVKR